MLDVNTHLEKLADELLTGSLSPDQAEVLAYAGLPERDSDEPVVIDPTSRDEELAELHWPNEVFAGTFHDLIPDVAEDVERDRSPDATDFTTRRYFGYSTERIHGWDAEGREFYETVRYGWETVRLHPTEATVEDREWFETAVHALHSAPPVAFEPAYGRNEGDEANGYRDAGAFGSLAFEDGEAAPTWRKAEEGMQFMYAPIESVEVEDYPRDSKGQIVRDGFDQPLPITKQQVNTGGSVAWEYHRREQGKSEAWVGRAGTSAGRVREFPGGREPWMSKTTFAWIASLRRKRFGSLQDAARKRESVIQLVAKLGGDPRDPQVVAWINRLGMDAALAALGARAIREAVAAKAAA